MRLHLDFETYATVDLPKEGLARYLADPEFEVTLTALAIGEGPVLQWGGIPAALLSTLARIPDLTWHAFNAPFEIGCLKRNGIDISLSRWRCTMGHAYARAFTGNLKRVGEQIGIENGKLDSGTRLINLWSKPRKPTKNNPKTRLEPADRPDAWEEFKLYNRVDVLAEREIWTYLNRWPWTAEEQARWELDRRINDRGVPVDVEMAETAVNLIDKYRERYEQEVGLLTGGLASTQRDKLLAWIRANGTDLPDLRAETIEMILEQTPIR